jgi:excisionase family DNA binding protein
MTGVTWGLSRKPYFTGFENNIMPAHPNDPHIELCTIPEAAALLRVSPRTVWRMIKARELNEIRVRSRVFVSMDEIQRYLRHH